jgi:hypothetical protein
VRMTSCRMTCPAHVLLHKGGAYGNETPSYQYTTLSNPLQPALARSAHSNTQRAQQSCRGHPVSTYPLVVDVLPVQGVSAPHIQAVRGMTKSINISSLLATAPEAQRFIAAGGERLQHTPTTAAPLTVACKQHSMHVCSSISSGCLPPCLPWPPACHPIEIEGEMLQKLLTLLVVRMMAVRRDDW